MNCIIIEDDKLSIKVVKELINRTVPTELVASYENVAEKLLERHAKLHKTKNY